MKDTRATLFAMASQYYNAVKLCCSNCQVTRSVCPLKACQCNSRFYCPFTDVAVGQALLCVATMSGDKVQIAGAGIGFIDLRQILPSIWLDQIQGYIRDDSVSLAVVIGLASVRILPFRIATEPVKDYSLASFLNHVNSGTQVTVVRNFRAERDGTVWEPYVSHVGPL
ncbi:hypothetical protein MVEN_00066500 [Mycena venus]|uniref:Uncharacterized protein n=1 Tax=Mycena venus TaxID=2733690 RepID=A0A8H6Z7A7_9AGAR|nr:hypothetical protein MVEN_00066500 [Mycena venus]